MKSAFIIKDKTGKPYAVVALLAGGTEFYPIAESATTWASWMKDEYAARVITKQQLSSTLDNSMDVEGPLVTSRANKVKIDELIAKAKKTQEVEPIESAKEQKSAELVPVISLMDARLDYLENSEWRNAVEFKAKSFIADVNKSTFSYEVKRTRAAWDPTLAVPGTERQGGWRCPPGTRNGGQITDRFGRNCGWGVARRLANEIADLGERLEDAGDKRRVGRVARRNERVARRMAQGGRLERAARGIGDALDVTNRPDAGTVDSPKPRGAGLLERVAGRVGNALDTDERSNRRRRRGNRGGAVGAFIEGFREGWNGEETLPDGTPDTRRPKIPMGGVREPRLPDGTIAPGKTPAPRRPKAPQARPARPRQPRVPRTPAGADGWGGPGRAPANDIVSNRREYLRRMQEQLDALKKELRRNRPDGVDNKDWKKYQEYLDNHRPVIGFGGADDFSVMDFNQWAKTNNVNVPNNQNAPAAPRRPRQPQVDNVSKTPVPAGPPRAAETLDQYKTRKYNEHQKRVREIRDAGGNAGFLTREEWEQFHGPEVEAAYNRRNAAGRGARRAATDAGAARTATRRPKPADVPDANQPPRRQRKPFNAPGQRGLGTSIAARRKRNQMEMDNQGAVRYGIVKHNGKYYVVDNEEIRRANAAGANLDVLNEGPRPPARPPAAPAAPRVTPPSPAAGDAGLPQELKPQRTPRQLGKQELVDIDKAIDHLHEKDGALADVRDGIVVDAVLDNDIKDANGNAMDRNQIMTKGISRLLGVGGKFSNKRYDFELVKPTPFGQMMWEVIKVKDKKTGEVWFLKTSQYGQNDGLLENIGMNAAQALEFGNDENHLRLNALQTPESGKDVRWIMMRDVNQWNHGQARLQQNFKDAGKWRGDPGKLEPRDAARLAVMDFIFGNEDRHGGNFMIAEDDRGVARIAVIDNGLLAGGRLRSGNNVEVTPSELDARAARLKDYRIGEYAQGPNNGIDGLKNIGFKHQNQRNREIFAEQSRRAAERLQTQLDSILSVDRIERNGVKLSEVEKAHIKALRTIAENRIAYLVNGGGIDDLVGQFN